MWVVPFWRLVLLKEASPPLLGSLCRLVRTEEKRYIWGTGGGLMRWQWWGMNPRTERIYYVEGGGMYAIKRVFVFTVRVFVFTRTLTLTLTLAAAKQRKRTLLSSPGALVSMHG